MMLSKPIQVSAAGANTIVPGVPGKVIRVFAWSLAAVGLDATDTQTVLWQSSTGPVNLTGPRPLTVAGPVWDMPMPSMRVASRDAYLETAVGDGLILNLGSSVDVNGFMNYEIVPV